MKIKAAVARIAGQPLSIEEIDIEAPRDKEILVEVVATGVCHTDLVVRDGMLPTPMPVVLGHEGAGIVKAVGAGVNGIQVGDHIVMSYNSCGTCPSCAEGEKSYCHEFFPRNFFALREDGTSALSQEGKLVHGNFFGQSSFASYAICHESNAIKVDKSLPLELLGPLACGMQTGAGAVLNALKVQAGKSFIVFGAGSVGLSAIMAAKSVGAEIIIAVDMQTSRLDIARELGASHTINPTEGDVVQQVIAITGYGVYYALDTTGIPVVIRSAVECLAPRGVCGILGASGPDAEIVLNETHFMSGGRRLMGIVEGEADPQVFIPKLIDMYLQGNFPFDKLVTYYSADNINQAIEDSKSGVSIKPIVRWQ